MNFNNPFKGFFKKTEQVKTKTVEQFTPEEIEKFSKRAMRATRKGVMYLMMSTPFMSMASGPGSDLKMSKNEKTGSNNEWFFDINERSQTRDTAGVVEFNPGVIVAPLQVNFESQTTHTSHTKMMLPYSWSRNFTEIEMMSPAERDSVKEVIIKEVQQELMRNINFWGYGIDAVEETTEEVYNYKHGVNETPHSVKTRMIIDRLTIKGIASAEGTGKESFLPGNIDAKNVSLAGNRANDYLPYIKEALKRLGIDVKVLETLSPEEVQFSDSEVNTLYELASQGCYIENGDLNENVQAMIKAYNRQQIKDTSVVKQLDQIIGTKRGVEIEKYSHGTESSTTVIPFPLLLMLLPFLRKLKKGPKTPQGPITPTTPNPNPNPNPNPAPTPTTPRQIFSETTFDKEKVEAGDQNFHDVYRSALETEGATAKDREIIYETVLAEEIATFIGNREAINKGLDYLAIIDLARHMRTNGDPAYRFDDEIKEILAEEVLLAWQRYDRNVRGGIKAPDDKGELKDLSPETTMDYRHDPKKVLWAIEAALHLFELGGAQTDTELVQLIEEKINGIEDRRYKRGNTKKRNDRGRTKKAVPDVVVGPQVQQPSSKGLVPEVKITSATTTPEKKVAKKAAAKKVAKKAAPAPSVTKTTPIRNPAPGAASTQTIEPQKVSPIQAASEKYEPVFGSEENDDILRAAWGLGEQPANLPLEEEPNVPQKKDELQNQIDAIDIQLRALEKELETQVKQFKSPKASTEQKFNELEQQKRVIQAALEKTK